MLGMGIRLLGSKIYRYPQIQEDLTQPGRFGKLKLALVADHFTSSCLAEECRVRHVTPQNYRDVLKTWQPDALFIESVFHGSDGCWRYRVGKQPAYLRLTKPKTIFKVIEFARFHGIPTVFWNKDDGAFFQNFLHVAKAADYVFTTDEECLAGYRAHVPAHVPVNTLTMPYQPTFHNFTGFHFTTNAACFTGSYYQRILNERRRFLDMAFDACEETDLRLNIFDRNQGRLSRRFEFNFPDKPQLCLHGTVPHEETAQIYKAHILSLNVNSVTDSGTMYSRRLLEILACGGIAVTNPSPAVDRYFRDYCHVISTPEEAVELFSRLKAGGPSQDDKDRAQAGAVYVQENHTWEHRLEELCSVVNL